MAVAVPEWQLVRVMDGYITTQLLYVAAKLGVPEVLAGGPRSGAEVAEAVGADPAAVVRVLRGLAVEEVVDELDGDRFALTPLGEALRAMQGPIVARGELYYRAAAGLLDAVKDGGTAFDRVYGERFFDHLEHPRITRPPSRRRWQGAPSGRRATWSPPTTSAAWAGWSTSAAAAASSCPRSCVPLPRCAAC